MHHLNQPFEPNHPFDYKLQQYLQKITGHVHIKG